MGEWPKKMWASGMDWETGEEGVSVIPADLGRELYEALKATLSPVPYPVTATTEALNRYEREVDRGDH